MHPDDIKIPYSMRFTRNERKRFDVLAAKLNLSVPDFFRLMVLCEDVDQQIAFLHSQINLRSENAKLLAAFGKGRVSSSLNQIAKHMNIGSFELTPEVEEEIHFIHDTYIIARKELIKLQGLKA